MTVPVPRLPAGQRRSARVAAACATLLVVLLPALVAGSGLDAAPTPAERRFVLDAIGVEPHVASSDVARRYCLTALGDEAEAVRAAVVTPDAGLPPLALPRARTLQILVLGAVSGALYLVVLLARGRVQALLACTVLAVLPPVALTGARLRPEAPAVLFALLALVLLQSFAQTAARRPVARQGRRLVSLAGLGACAAVALGLATAALPSHGAPVVLPAFVLTVGAAFLLVRGVAVLRRVGFERFPCRAWNARLLPWTAIGLLAPGVVVLVLRSAVAGPIEALAGTPADVGLLPANGIARALTLSLGAVGAAVAVLRVGLRFGRGARLGAELVLLVYCALELVAFATAPARLDRLPMAPALAILVAEGARLVMFVGAWFWSRRPPRVAGRDGVTSARRGR